MTDPSSGIQSGAAATLIWYDGIGETSHGRSRFASRLYASEVTPRRAAKFPRVLAQRGPAVHRARESRHGPARGERLAAAWVSEECGQAEKESQ